jgi:hypothetical protein
MPEKKKCGPGNLHRTFSKPLEAYQTFGGPMETSVYRSYSVAVGSMLEEEM